MNRLPFFLAWRYLVGSNHEKSIGTMIRLCFGGVFIGTFALALVLAIMHGVEHITHEKLRTIHPPIIARVYNEHLDLDALAAVFRKEFPEIAHYSPSDSQHAIVQSNAKGNTTTLVSIKGVDPLQETAMNALAQRVIAVDTGEKTLENTLRDGSVIIGKTLAEELAVAPGDPITLLFSNPETSSGRTIKLKHHQVHVSGIFESGIEEFDAHMILSSLTFLQELCPEAGPTELGIILTPGADEATVITRLNDHLGLDAYSWKELYPALISALKLEKYAMFLILSLIILVASLNIVSLLFMQITHKRSDIAILQALGASETLIKTIFFSIGTIITLAGSISGISAALCVGWFLDRYPLITLPNAYYVSHLPIYLDGALCLIVFLLVVTLSLVATWIPTRGMKNIPISQVLRFE